MADWRHFDQAAGLRRLFGAEVAPMVAFAAGAGLPDRANFILRTARRLAVMGQTVVVVDEVGGREGVAGPLGLVTGIDLIDVLAGDACWAEALVEISPGLRLLEASRAAKALGPGELGLGERLESSLRELRGEVGYVLINCALGRDGMSRVAASADQFVVGTTANGASITSAYSLIKRAAREQQRDSAHLAILGARPAGIAQGIYDNMRQTAQRHLGLSLAPVSLEGAPGVEDMATAIASRFPTSAQQFIATRNPAVSAPLWRLTARESVV